MKTTDIVVVGGGIIGFSLAYGLAKKGAHVNVLDNVKGMYSASRGNFGLVWVQGKGQGMPHYAEWTLQASREWHNFSEELSDASGIEIDYQQPGGFEVCLGEKEWSMRKAELEQLRDEFPGGNYDYQMLDRKQMQEYIPKMRLGEIVTGASYCQHDGHLNPLKLLTALIAAHKETGAELYTDQKVESVSYRNKCFEIKTAKDNYSAKKVILACGLGIKKLAQQVGLNIPIRPQRGQILVTERAKPSLEFPFVTIRQTHEGSFMLGASHEEVGYNTETTLDQMRKIATHTVQTFPELSRLQLIRCWGALRVLTPDAKPVYVESESCPGAYVATSHSGITLTPLHARILPAWILEGTTPEGFEQFHSNRFDA